MMARPVSQAGIAKIDQLTEKLRQQRFRRLYEEELRKIPYNAGALVMGF